MHRQETPNSVGDRKQCGKIERKIAKMHVIYRAEVRHIFSRTHENDMQAGPTCSHVFLDLTSCNPACFL